MKIVCLCENTAYAPQFRAEHGLSLYIETNGYKLLFDTGQSDLFISNAERLGIRLDEVDAAVISHGHYDHGGGIRGFMKINSNAKIYLSRHAFDLHYNADGKYIGLDRSLICEERICFVNDAMNLSDNLGLYSCNGRPRVVDIDSAGLTVAKVTSNTVTEQTAEPNIEKHPDDFSHEIYLRVYENGRSFLFSGCSHKGILNIVEWFRPDLLIGGFHFMKLSTSSDKDRLISAAERLKQYDTVYYTCHCTGGGQYSLLATYMGNKLHYLASGQTLML